jgi:hypothetical protein
MTVIDEPAAAVAAGRCVTARSLAVPGRDRTMANHPGPCAWCDYPLADLARMVDGFNAWAGWDERRRTYDRHDARVFQDLPRAEQERRIVEAQGFDLVAPTVVEAAAPVADLDDIDLEAWA